MKTNGGKINKLLIILFIQSFIVAIPANGMLSGSKVASAWLQRALAKQIMQKPQVVDNVFFNKQQQFVRNLSTKKLLNACRRINPDYFQFIAYGIFFLDICMWSSMYFSERKNHNEAHKDYMEAHKKYMDKWDELTDYKRDANKKLRLLKEDSEKELKVLNQQLLEEKTLRDKELEKNTTLRNYIKTNNHKNGLVIAAVAAVIPGTVIVQLLKACF